MNVTIINSEVQDKGKYKAVVVAYKDEAGKVNQKNVVSFGPTAPAFGTLSKAANGQVYTIISQKNDKGYWDWIGAILAGTGEVSTPEAAPAASKATAAVRSSYETPDERARRQVYIVRQSSISAAVEVLTHNNPKGAVDPGDVIKMAQQFVDFVFSAEAEELPEVAL